jgi:hypothetical protein
MGNKTMHHNKEYWKMRRKLVKDAGYQIDEKQAEKENVETAVKAEIFGHLQEIRQKTDEIVNKLNNLKDANKNTRININKRVRQAIKDLKTAISGALSGLE